MSAPKTNIEKQKRRHWPVLLGMAVVLIFAGIVFLNMVGTAVEPPPDDASEINEIDGAPTTQDEIETTE